jgi:hypothetical protein
MRISSGQKSLKISPRWLPRIGAAPAQPLNLAVNPPWAGVANIAGVMFKALYPRPSKFKIKIYNAFLDYSCEIIAPLFASFYQDGTSDGGYHEDGYAFTWYGAVTNLLPNPIGRTTFIQVGIVPRVTPSLIGKLPTQIPPPIPNPPVNDYYFLYIYFINNSTQDPPWFSDTIYLGTMSGDNQSPFTAPPFYPTPDAQWSLNHQNNVTLNNGVSNVNIGKWDVTEITVTDWEPID